MSLASEMIQNNQMDMEIVHLLSGGIIEPQITLVACGGAAIDTVDRSAAELKGTSKILINTDMFGLQRVEAERKICIGKGITFRNDSGGFVEVAEKCAELAKDEIREALASAHVVFIIAGYGGGTGTALAPVVARIANGLGKLTFAICIMPFSAEGPRRELAEEHLPILREAAFSTVVFDNDSLLRMGKNIPLHSAFRAMDRNVVKLIRDTTENMGRSFIATLAEEIMACQSEMATADSGPVTITDSDLAAYADLLSQPTEQLPDNPDITLVNSGGMFERS